MHLRRLTVSTALFLQACAQVPLGRDTVAILPPAAYAVPSFGGRWTPSEEQVLAARVAARQRLGADVAAPAAAGSERWRVSNAREILKSWRSYRLQAFGYTEHHRRLIRLSFLTLDERDNGSWRKDLYVVSDGGTAYWQADYDPDTGKIVWWESNAVA